MSDFGPLQNQEIESFIKRKITDEALKGIISPINHCFQRLQKPIE